MYSVYTFQFLYGTLEEIQIEPIHDQIVEAHIIRGRQHRRCSCHGSHRAAFVKHHSADCRGSSPAKARKGRRLHFERARQAVLQNDAGLIFG